MYFIVHLVRQKNGRTIDPITFIPAQATPFPIDGDKEVDMTSDRWSKSKKTDGNSNSTYDTLGKPTKRAVNGRKLNASRRI